MVAMPERTLVLNATYEPISVVPSRRALILLLMDKGEAVVVSEAVVRSEKLEISVPSVLRLRTYVRVPYRRRAALSRRAVLARDDYRCQYCDSRAEGIDHIVPRSRKGTHTWENVVAACRPCNARKGDRLLEESGLRLSRYPTAPPAMSAAALQLRRIPEPWAPYLLPAVAVAVAAAG